MLGTGRRLLLLPRVLRRLGTATLELRDEQHVQQAHAVADLDATILLGLAGSVRELRQALVGQVGQRQTLAGVVEVGVARTHRVGDAVDASQVGLAHEAVDDRLRSLPLAQVVAGGDGGVERRLDLAAHVLGEEQALVQNAVRGPHDHVGQVHELVQEREHTGDETALEVVHLVAVLHEHLRDDVAEDGLRWRVLGALDGERGRPGEHPEDAPRQLALGASRKGVPEHVLTRHQGEEGLLEHRTGAREVLRQDVEVATKVVDKSHDQSSQIV